MRRLNATALVAVALAAATPAQGDPMENIIIPETTVYDAGEWKVAVSYVIRGKYRDAKGTEREGDKAGLVVFKKGARSGESEVTLEVGPGSEVRLGERVLDVVRVVNAPGGEGAVELRPRK